MPNPITVPRLGWNMEQGVFAGWLKADGATVRAGEPLFTLEGEKATEEIEGFENGVLHIPADGPKPGDVVAVGTVIGFVLQLGEPIPQRVAVAEALRPLGERTEAIRDNEAPAPIARATRHASSPRARRVAAERGLDWKSATGTGRTGRIRERDVLALTPSPASPTRRVIAERMLTSHRSTAPVTLMTTIDATEVVALRNRWKSERADMPTYTDLLVKLAAAALQMHPVLNSRWEDDRVVTQAGIHIGIAVDTDTGLVVPVVRDVPRLTLWELSITSRELIERARTGKLVARELGGGTFTVTSLGSFGIDAFTPIINYPECAILGVGRIRRCPVVIGDQIAIRDQVTLSLTFDHRIADGAPAARFLQTLTAAVENPHSLLSDGDTA